MTAGKLLSMLKIVYENIKYHLDFDDPGKDVQSQEFKKCSFFYI